MSKTYVFSKAPSGGLQSGTTVRMVMQSDTVAGARYPELTPILDTVLDAVVVIGVDGVVVAWNAIAEATFGWAAEQAIGRSLSDLIVPPAHRAAHNGGIQRLLGGAAPRVLNQLIEISAMTAQGREIPVELAITRSQTSNGPLFVGFLRDITAKKQAEETLRRQADEARMMFDVARMAAAAESFDDALNEVLRAICRISGWAVGHAFLVSGGETPRLLSTSIWYEEVPGDATALRLATEGQEFRAGVGLPGMILSRDEAIWVADIEKSTQFPRAGLGFRGAFGFPVKSQGRLLAILEFFAHSPSPPDDQRLLTVRTLGEQLGRIFERRQREDRERVLLHELNHRVKNQLTVIDAIATQTFRRAPSIEAGLKAFGGRLQALGRAQVLMLASDWTVVRLRELLEVAIVGSGNTLDRFDISGPEVKVSAGQSVAVSLAIHELCTNSVKYGSLSTDQGRVLIAWTTDEARQHIDFSWREVGGPLVIPPTTQGFGSRLLGANLESTLGGVVTISYPPEGLQLHVSAPLSDINSPA